MTREEYMKLYYQTHKEQNRLKGIWSAMKHRCKPGHKYYGDKGINVCEEWQDYRKFESWSMANGYSPGLTIDRIDGNLGYSPENCRWVTRKSQQRNTSSNVMLTFNGKTRCLREWAEVEKISEYALRNRVRRGWNIEKAITTPARKYERKCV